MALHRVNNFDGGVLNSDAANTAGAIVERDGSGNVTFNLATLAGLANSAGTTLTVAAPITGTATMATTATIQPVDATGGAFTLTLPPASTSSGQFYIFVRTDATALTTLKGSGAELINGANTYTGLSAQYKIAILFCNGTKWFGGLLA